jgi:hypothetical protein
MSDRGFGELPFCMKPCIFFGSFSSNKHQLLCCTSKFKIESQGGDVQVWKWKVFWLALDSPRWIPCNFGRAGKKANMAGTHRKRLYGSRARKKWTVDGGPPLSQQRKACWQCFAYPRPHNVTYGHTGIQSYLYWSWVWAKPVDLQLRCHLDYISHKKWLNATNAWLISLITN